MTVKEYLKQAFTLDKLIKARESQINDLRDKIGLIRNSTDGVKIQSSAKPNHMEDLIVRLLDMINNYEKDILRLIQLKTEIRNVIENIDNPRYKLILTERYINFKRWEDIAADNNYSWQWVHKMHKKVLEKLAIKSDILDVL